jgi:hypothetical protein
MGKHWLLVVALATAAGCGAGKVESPERSLIGYQARVPASWLRRYLEMHAGRSDDIGIVLEGCGRPREDNTGCERGVEVVAYSPTATDPPRVVFPTVGNDGWRVIEAHGEPHVEVFLVYLYKEGGQLLSHREALKIPVRDFRRAPRYHAIREAAEALYPNETPKRDQRG